MDEEDFIKFLEKANRTPQTIAGILESLSLSGTKKLFAPTGWVLTDEKWAEITSIRRKDFVESIQILEGGGAMWDEHSQSYLKRDDFPKGES